MEAKSISRYVRVSPRKADRVLRLVGGLLYLSGMLIMAWNVAGPKEAKIPVKAAMVAVTDMLGTPREVAAANGVVTVAIGPCPVYLGEK